MQAELSRRCLQSTEYDVCAAVVWGERCKASLVSLSALSLAQSQSRQTVQNHSKNQRQKFRIIPRDGFCVRVAPVSLLCESTPTHTLFSHTHCLSASVWTVSQSPHFLCEPLPPLPVCWSDAGWGLDVASHAVLSEVLQPWSRSHLSPPELLSWRKLPALSLLDLSGLESL